jgi:hypothetical protein
MSPAAPATIITPTLRRRRGLTEQAAVADAQAYGSILPTGFPKESGTEPASRAVQNTS